MSKIRVLFVINPISGGKSKAKFVAQVERYLDMNRFDPRYVYTEGPEQVGALTQNGVREKVDVIVAVGGDGTINEVARYLLYKPIPLGVIPYGSGNGFARSLNIPLKTTKAIQRLNQMRVKQVDSGMLNGKSFFNMGGLGFDAAVSTRFSKTGNRGVFGYMLTAIATMLSFKPRECQIEMGTQSRREQVFMLSFANSPQFGNNAYIAPKASMEDGLLDLCIVRPFPIYLFPKMVYHLFNKSAHKSNYTEFIQFKAIKILVDAQEIVHLDGEPYRLGEVLELKVLPKSLKVIY